MREFQVGDLNPRLVIQKGFKECLSACLISLVNPEIEAALELTQEKITRLLNDVGLANDIGVGMHVAEDMNVALRRVGFTVSQCYGVWGLDDEDPKKIESRIQAIENALQDGKGIVVAFTRDRGGGTIPFTHFALVSGYEIINGEKTFTVMDPSEIDGQIRRCSLLQFQEYVTTKAGLPVCAWAIQALDVDGLAKEQNKSIHKFAEFNNRDLTPGNELLEAPLWMANQLGFPIPTGTDHPISVAMPTRADVDQWGQYGDAVLSVQGRRPYGYPRFVIDPWVRELAVKEMGSIDWLGFPSKVDAIYSSYLANTYAHDNPQIVEKGGLFWLNERDGDGLNRDAWQFCGLGLSSRQARAYVEGRDQNDLLARASAQESIKEEISLHTNAIADDIYLFPTGMAAVHMINEVLKELNGPAPSIQFGFPYTDTYAIERRFGPGINATQNVIDIRDCDIEQLKNVMQNKEPIRGIFTEWPTNPTLHVPPLDQIAEISGGQTPVVLDDTIGTMFNLDYSKLPNTVDVRVTSLTKYFSSVGDVMGGSLVLNPNSPFYEPIKAKLETRYVDNTWFEDVQVLAKNSAHFREYMPVINANGNKLATWLNDEFSQNNGLIENVYYPRLIDQRGYDRFRSSMGGYGGLLSLDFVDPQVAYRFYDALEISKGPGLGTYYSLGCLYTKLAHKNEISAIEKFGVTEHLIRISAGIEPFNVLQERFAKAIDVATH